MALPDDLRALTASWQFFITELSSELDGIDQGMLNAIGSVNSSIQQGIIGAHDRVAQAEATIANNFNTLGSRIQAAIDALESTVAFTNDELVAAMDRQTAVIRAGQVGRLDEVTGALQDLSQEVRFGLGDLTNVTAEQSELTGAAIAEAFKPFSLEQEARISELRGDLRLEISRQIVRVDTSARRNRSFITDTVSSLVGGIVDLVSPLIAGFGDLFATFVDSVFERLTPDFSRVEGFFERFKELQNRTVERGS